jgi:hypothetical protein
MWNLSSRVVDDYFPFQSGLDPHYDDKTNSIARESQAKKEFKITKGLAFIRRKFYNTSSWDSETSRYRSDWVCVDSTSDYKGGCVDIDECLSSPCQFGGKCIDGRSSYRCDCPLPYVGEHCQLVAHGAFSEQQCECDMQSPLDAPCTCEVATLRDVFPKSTIWADLEQLEDAAGAVVRDNNGDPVMVLVPRVNFWSGSLSFVMSGQVDRGLGRMMTLRCRSSASYQIHREVWYLSF